MHEFQDKWSDETGGKWDKSSASAGLFRMMLKVVLPEEVQEKLEGIVGLNTMEWNSFLAYNTSCRSVQEKEKGN